MVYFQLTTRLAERHKYLIEDFSRVNVEKTTTGTGEQSGGGESVVVGVGALNGGLT